MYGAELRDLAMWCSGRNGKPLGCVRQVDIALQIELGVVTETCHVIGSAIGGVLNGEFATIQSCGSLTGAIGHAYFEIRRVVVIDGNNQHWSRLGSRAHFFG